MVALDQCVGKIKNYKIKMTITMEEESKSMSTKCVKRVWKSVTNCPRSGRVNGFSRRAAFPLIKLS